MDDVEDYWERGAGSTVPRIKGINHNLAVYGWDLRDALVTTAETMEAKILQPTDHFFKQIIENANERAALRVLKSAQDDDGRSLTAFEAAARLGEEGTQENPGQGDGIETLIVLLGANNALPSMLSLRGGLERDGYDDPEQNEQFTVWNPVHFQAELDLVVKEIKKIKARHVILGTVPHVTIAPIARGVGSKVRRGSRYYPFYTRPWISTEDFDVGRDPHVTEQEARAIDSAIDQYNDAVAKAVEDARKRRPRLVPLRGGRAPRPAGSPTLHRRPAGETPVVAPVRASTELKALSPEPDSRFFVAGPEGRTQGGLFSLDGVHPTTIGYGILAQELINVMQQHAGVKFYLGDGKTGRTGPVRVDFGRLIARDTLISNPPRSLDSDLRLIAWVDEVLDGILGRLLL